MEVSNTEPTANPEAELSGLEQIYYMLDVNAPTNACVVVEVEGKTSVEQWRAAVVKVASRAPVLSSRIVRNPAGLLAFELLSTISLPFHVVSGDLDGWLQIMKKEISTRIHLGRGPLFRATLLHSSSRAVFLLSISHCIADGRSAVALLRDILRTLVNEPLGPPYIVRSIDSLLVEATAGKWRPPLAQVPIVESKPIVSNPEAPVHLAVSCFDEQLMTRLRDRARAEKATVHGALNAALVQVFVRDVATSGSLTSGIDVRPILAFGQEGLRPVISSCTVKFANDDLPFWEIARRIKEALRQENRLEAIVALYEKVGEFCVTCPTPELIRERLIGKSDEPEILLTNLGVLPIPLSYGADSIKLKGFWASIHPASQNMHFLCCATINGRLQISYTASIPVSDLFNKLQAKFLAAML
jgi:NRPS condensation-like uncharacterized protein